MNKLIEWTCCLLALVLTCCTEEVQQEGNGPLPGADNDGALKREVTLTLKNKLVVPQAGTKTGGTETKAIATAEENYIRSLDVYVFGSETEDGEYTFQELFYYRDDASLLTESYAKPINLTAAGDNTTALLKLSKGLFVKLYCVANYAELFLPEGDGAASSLSVFLVPLTQSAPGEPENVVTPGEPTETVFLTSITEFMMPGAIHEVLTTPLAMSGSYTTPLDLTDFDNSARTQMSFKLTRLNARFDVVNDAAKSKFTIKSIAMGNARIGATFFPIRPLDEDITSEGYTRITTMARPFDGNQANTGLQPGAFYCYPSPKEDGGYLILKGTYAVNQTQSQEVTYQIPFKPSNADEGSFLEVAYNHRYTIAITDADPYHLDFTLTVADWADDGSIDEYTPGDEVDASIKVDVATDPNGLVVYDEATSTVTMPITTTSTFSLKASKGLELTKSYQGTPDDQQYDWLLITSPVATKAATENNYLYTFSIKEGYTGGKYPNALLRFKNIATGKSQLIRIEPKTTPIVREKNLTIAIGADTNIPYIDIEVECAQGTTISGPAWLTFDKTSDENTTATYRVNLDLNQPGVINALPASLPSNQTITLANRADASLTTDVTISFTETMLRAGADPLNYDVKETSDNSYRVTTAGKTIQVTAYTIFLQPSVTTAYDPVFGEGNSWLPAPGNPAKEVSGNRFKYTYDIVIPACEGTDPDYQLHKGTVTIKAPGDETIKKYTLWRGASNIPYPSKSGSTPYYSAVKVGDLWWAPMNVGATEVAKNNTDLSSTGYLYQWGRNVPTTYGSSNYISGPVSDENATDEFITDSIQGYDWLTPSNNYLWCDAAGNKTTKDPCPVGWRIPTIDELDKWASSDRLDNTFRQYTAAGQNGINLVLPTVGYRSYNDGTSHDRDSNGYYWSSTPENSNTSTLFNVGYDDRRKPEKRSMRRTFANSIRCIRE